MFEFPHVRIRLGPWRLMVDGDIRARLVGGAFLRYKGPGAALGPSALPHLPSTLVCNRPLPDAPGQEQNGNTAKVRAAYSRAQSFASASDSCLWHSEHVQSRLLHVRRLVATTRVRGCWSIRQVVSIAPSLGMLSRGGTRVDRTPADRTPTRAGNRTEAAHPRSRRRDHRPPPFGPRGSTVSGRQKYLKRAVPFWPRTSELSGRNPLKV